LSIEHKFLVPVCLETGKNGRGYRSRPSQKRSEYPKSTCCDEGVQLRGRGDATGVAIERLSSHVSSEKKKQVEEKCIEEITTYRAHILGNQPGAQSVGAGSTSIVQKSKGFVEVVRMVQ